MSGKLLAAEIGTVTISEDPQGLLFTPDLSGFAPGGHEGPAGTGHLGDLPRLVVGADGTAKAAVAAPRLKLSDVLNRSLMIHADGEEGSPRASGLGFFRARRAKTRRRR